MRLWIAIKVNYKYARAILKYEVSISVVSIICALNRTVGMEVNGSKFFFSRLLSKSGMWYYSMECRILQLFCLLKVIQCKFGFWWKMTSIFNLVEKKSHLEIKERNFIKWTSIVHFKKGQFERSKYCGNYFFQKKSYNFLDFFIPWKFFVWLMATFNSRDF